MARKRDLLIRRLAREGLTVSEIAETVDVSIARVHRAFARDREEALGDDDVAHETDARLNALRNRRNSLQGAALPRSGVDLRSLKIKPRRRKRTKSAVKPAILAAEALRRQLLDALWKRASARATVAAFNAAAKAVTCSVESTEGLTFGEVLDYLRTLADIEPLPLPADRHRLGAIAILDKSEGGLSLVVECAIDGDACFRLSPRSAGRVRKLIEKRFNLRMVETNLHS